MPSDNPDAAPDWRLLLQARLSLRTYRHCLSVADLMLKLAPEMGIAPDRAETAGLLHDLCKSLSDEELLHAAREYGIEVTAAQLKKPGLLHGVVAAAECKNKLGVTDEQVLDAIQWHTTGCPNLGPVGLALYFADFAEPLRTHPEAAHARALWADKGFPAALLAVSQWKLDHIQSRKDADPMTEQFHAWLQNHLCIKAVP